MKLNRRSRNPDFPKVRVRVVNSLKIEEITVRDDAFMEKLGNYGETKDLVHMSPLC